MVARQRPSVGRVEEVLDGLLTNADQAMVNAFTTGFRVAQAKGSIERSLSDANAVAAALESAQVVALGILVREQLDPSDFEALYRPFATVLPGPTSHPAGPIDQQIATFIRLLPTLTGEPEQEVSSVAKTLSVPPKPESASGVGAPVIAAMQTLDPAANFTAAWKQVIATANQAGRTNSFRAMQDAAEQAAPHDGLGIVGFAGVAAGAIFMRDVLPIEKVLLLYEPFGSAFPYESLA